MKTRTDEIEGLYPGHQVLVHRDGRGVNTYALADRAGKRLTEYFSSVNQAEWSIIDQVRVELRNRGS